MFGKRIFRLLVLVLLLAVTVTCNSQGAYTISPAQKNEDCTKGAAGIQITGLQTNDILTLTWSSGQTDVFTLSELNAGEYSVHVIIKSKPDSILKLDSTIVIKVEKEECLIGISNHFTPNGDNYNDVWQMSNTQYYPNFELFVFNKWGQQVHSQKGTYTPWDGKWNGINTPDGTYYYVFYYDGGHKNKFQKGDVTVLR